jgi:predicted transcriptional regulator
MNNNIVFTQLREQAIALRRAGKSRREIADLLGITSNQRLNEALRGEPP